MFSLKLIHSHNRTKILLTLSLCSLAMIIRLCLIKSGLAQSSWIDLSIYRSAGALFNNGVNPFDAQEVLQNPISELVRTDPRYFDAYASDISRWPYYVSGNPPMSVLLWSIIELLGRNSGLFHQVVYSVTDIIVFLLALLIFKQIAVLRIRDVLALSILTVFNPIVLWWGTWLPEEKQVQTALMLLLIYFMSRPSYLMRGLTSSLVVLFKAVGLPLAAIAGLQVLKAKNINNTIIFVAGIFVPLLFSVLFFQLKFIDPLVSRLLDQSNGAPIHDSMWVVLPSLFDFRYYLALLLLVAGVIFSRINIDPQWRPPFLGVWFSLVPVMMLTISGSWDRQMMVLLPAYLLLYCLVEKTRILVIAQSIACSWIYFWYVWLGPELGFSGTVTNLGSLTSALSITGLAVTIFLGCIQVNWLNILRIFSRSNQKTFDTKSGE